MNKMAQAGTKPPQAADETAAALYRGYLDGLDPRWHVIGWVRALAAEGERVTVELVEAGAVLSRDVALRFRGDLLDAKIGDGCYGFHLPIPAALFDGLRHGFTVRVAHGAGHQIGQLDILLPSRQPKNTAPAENAPVEAARLVENLLGGDAPVQPLQAYAVDLTAALNTVARDYDLATALGLLYIHVLRRRIDEDGLRTRLTRLSQDPAQLGDVVREILESEEAQGWIARGPRHRLPGLEALWAWTRLRPISAERPA